MIYYLSCDEGEEFSYGMKALDGDLKKIRPADMTPDGGIEILPMRGKFGRALETAHLPTRIRIEGPKRPLTDLRAGYGTFVDAKFKAAVEKLEPNVHQFFPIAFVWADGSPAGDRFWFNPCHRLDSVDRQKTSFEFRGVWYLDGDETRKLVFNRAQIGPRHAWMDKFISGMGGIWISGTLKENLEAAGVTGMALRAYEETD
jgi:hypothetical protein